MTTLTEWAHTYTAHLPPELRPNPDDPRYTRAVRNARANGWRAKQAADAVTARGYNGATNPRLLALQRLEELAATPGRPPRTTTTWTPPDPTNATPPEHVAERVQLIRRLNTANLTGETSQDAMTALIAKQRDRR